MARLEYSTNRSSVTNATINIRAVGLCGSQIIYVRGLLLLSVRADIEDGTTMMKDGTNLKFVINSNVSVCCVFIRISYVVTLYIISVGLVLS